MDNNYSALLFADPKHPSLPELASRREQDIKDNIMNIVDQPSPPNGPPPIIGVVAWLGDLHFADSHGTEEQKSAGELLRMELAKRNELITTFGSQIGNGPVAGGTNLYPLTSSLSRPVSVATNDQQGHPNVLGNLPLFRSPERGFPKLSSFDNMLIFPRAAEPMRSSTLLSGRMAVRPDQDEDGPGGAGGGIGGREDRGVDTRAMKPNTEAQKVIDTIAKPMKSSTSFSGRTAIRPDQDEDGEDRGGGGGGRDRDGDTRSMKPNTEAQKVIDTMKDTKPASEKKPERYVPETANENEIERLGSRDMVIDAKRELNSLGRPSIEVLTEAMKNNRVLGLEYGFFRSRLEYAPLSSAMMESLKGAGATHVVAPFSQVSLDEFMKTGKVDTTKVNANPSNASALIIMQAALQNGLKLVSSFDSALPLGETSQYKREVEVVRDILKDKNTKVVLLTLQDRLANTVDRDGQALTGQLMRNEADPANPTEKIKFISVSQLDPKHAYAPMSIPLANLEQPVAIELAKTKILGNVKAANYFNFKTTPTMNSWDILMAWP